MIKKLVYGVGINDADYVTHINKSLGFVNGKKVQQSLWKCPFYRSWLHMLERCYSEKLLIRRPTYVGCYVCEDWLTFSNFKAWMIEQPWEGNQLDKDLLVQGNKVYSPETCVFVSRQVNLFLSASNASRGQYMLGVSWNKRDEKFAAQCSNPLTGKSEKLGHFHNELDAHKAWLKRKLEHACQLASFQADKRVAEALVGRYSRVACLEDEIASECAEMQVEEANELIDEDKTECLSHEEINDAS